MTALRPMLGRDVHEEHRSSTPLELFFDLTFVVGVSFAAEGLAHEVLSDHGAHGLLSYLMVFFAIWWGWLNFTWFASAYDTDDWLYRVFTLVQMAGALVVAAGVPRALSEDDYSIVVVGYLVMRLAMVFQWLRAARQDPPHRTTALVFASGIAAVQVLWVARLALLESLGLASFVVLALAELAVPIMAERQGQTTFHFGHVSERYGLFTLIVLGEGVLASAKSIVAAVERGEHVPELVTLAGFALVVIAGMWWTYFQVETDIEPTSLVATLRWGYGHYVLFAAAGAVSAGVEIQIEQVTGESHISSTPGDLLLALPVAAFIVLVWALIIRPSGRLRSSPSSSLVYPLLALLIAACGVLPLAALTTTAAVAVLVTIVVVTLVVDSRPIRSGADW